MNTLSKQCPCHILGAGHLLLNSFSVYSEKLIFTEHQHSCCFKETGINFILDFGRGLCHFCDTNDLLVTDINQTDM